jgi:GT2 family glycosyltransferase
VSLDLSIVILNWNTRDMLLECIQSIHAMTTTSRYEIIVVDNGSEDGSPDAVREHCPEVRLTVNDSNLGFARGINVGLRQCTGRYSCILNSDIELLDGCLDRLVAYLDANPDVGSVGPRTTNEDGSARFNCREVPSLRSTLMEALFLDRVFPRTRICRGQLYPGFDPDRTQPVQVLSGCLQVLRKEALDEVGHLDERFFIYAEDTDWGKRFNESGWRTMYFAEATAIHLGGVSASRSPIHFKLQQSHAGYQYWKKHASPLSYPVYVSIMLLRYCLRLVLSSGAFLLGRGDRANIRHVIKSSRAQMGWYLFNRGRHPILGVESGE